MNGRNTWGWVIGIIVVLLIIGGLWWWASPSMHAGDMASTTDMMASSSPTGTASSSSGPSLVNKSSESVATIVAGLTGDSQYAAAWSTTGVGSTITGKGPYTVFVSTDDGYNKLPAGTLANMTAAQKKRMIQYSVVSGKALDINAQDSGSIKTLSGDELNFSVGNLDVVQVNSSYALFEYKGSNGIVYVISQPLVPPTSKNILTP